MRRASLVVLLLVAGALLGAGLWLDRLFEVDRALETSSLVGELDARSVLGVFAHPDDEISVAGLLADAAAQPDVVVRTITATRGESGETHGAYRPEDLARVREAELRKYGSFLGLDAQEVWTHPDGELEAHVPTLVADVVRRIRALAPDLVVSFDPASGYSWHADHRAIGRATTDGVRLAADPDFEPSLGAPHRVKWLAYALAPKRVMRTFGGERGRNVARHQVEVTFAIPVARQLKTRGWQIHESQQGYLRRVWKAPPWLLYLFFDHEHYFVARPSP